MDISGSLEKPDIKILGNTLMSQIHLHEQYGGVYPNLAKREHEKNLPPLLQQTLKEAGYILTDDQQLTNNNIDVIAVTNGPGLEPALWVGINFALELGKKWDKPVIPVNHMEGHIFSVLYESKDALVLPALALLVSGGHTELVLVKDFGNYKIIGQTRDDAVGEAFDKVARMLGLSYPGGPKVSKLAELSRQRKKIDDIKFPRPMIHSKNLDFSFSGLKTRDDAVGEAFDKVARMLGLSYPGGPKVSKFAELSRQRKKIDDIKFPRPMIHSKNLDFSFSGLKTAVLYKIKEANRTDPHYTRDFGEVSDIFKEDIARAFEDAAIEVLIEKTRRALLESKEKIKTLIVAGGVSANTHLSREISKIVDELPDIRLHIPIKSLATDNALMIGIAAFIKTSKTHRINKNQEEIKAQGNLSIS